MIIHKFRVPLYQALIYLGVGDNCVADRVELSNIFGHFDQAEAEAICAYSRTGCFGLFFTKDGITAGTIAHEVFHCTVHIMDWVGIPVEAKNHEASAYLNEFITSEIYPYIMKTVKHVKKGKMWPSQK